MWRRGFAVQTNTRLVFRARNCKPSPWISGAAAIPNLAPELLKKRPHRGRHGNGESELCTVGAASRSSDGTIEPSDHLLRFLYILREPALLRYDSDAVLSD